MIAVVNCISGPSEFAGWIKDSFVATFETLNSVTGVRAFHLRRVPDAGRQCVFISITIWDSIEHFQSWRGSPAFVAAHPARERFQSEFEQMRSLRFDFDIDDQVTAATLDFEVAQRLSTAHPDLVSAGLFVDEVSWMQQTTNPQPIQANSPTTPQACGVTNSLTDSLAPPEQGRTTET